MFVFFQTIVIDRTDTAIADRTGVVVHSKTADGDRAVVVAAAVVAAVVRTNSNGRAEVAAAVVAVATIVVIDGAAVVDLAAATGYRIVATTIGIAMAAAPALVADATATIAVTETEVMACEAAIGIFGMATATDVPPAAIIHGIVIVGCQKLERMIKDRTRNIE